MGFPGGWELLVIALIVLLLFGGKKIPELMKGLGKGVKNCKDGMNGADDKKEESETLRNENKTLRNENENETLR